MTSGRDMRRGALHTVERNGSLVRRPVNRWTSAVHGLLKYLEDAGFERVPRIAGVKDGYEELSYLEGEAGLRPWPEVLKTDSGLTQLAGFLKSYHLAVKDYVPHEDTEWCAPDVKWQPGLIIRHGDLGPWNTIWRDDVLQGVIDWDFAEPGEAVTDLAQIAWYLVPLRGGEHCRKAGFGEPPVLRDRLSVLCEAYGGFRPSRVIQVLLDLQESEISRISTLGRRGIEPWRFFYRRGDLETIKRERDWLRVESRNLMK